LSGTCGAAGRCDAPQLIPSAGRLGQIAQKAMMWIELRAYLFQALGIDGRVNRGISVEKPFIRKSHPLRERFKYRN